MPGLQWASRKRHTLALGAIAMLTAIVTLVSYSLLYAPQNSEHAKHIITNDNRQNVNKLNTNSESDSMKNGKFISGGSASENFIKPKETNVEGHRKTANLEIGKRHRRRSGEFGKKFAKISNNDGSEYNNNNDMVGVSSGINVNHDDIGEFNDDKIGILDSSAFTHYSEGDEDSLSPQLDHHDSITTRQHHSSQQHEGELCFCL